MGDKTTFNAAKYANKTNSTTAESPSSSYSWTAPASKTSAPSLNIPNDYLCAMSEQLMTEPVIAADEYSYDRKNIELWFKKHDTSPVSGDKIDKTLTPNKALQKRITQWQEQQAIASMSKLNLNAKK